MGYFEMDKSIVAAEERHRRSDCLAYASQSLEIELIRINSIAIDISCAMEEIEPPAHDHFSLRGYVVGMREQNRKICLPFALEGKDDELMDGQSPLSVPKYRWWQCPSCVPDNNVGGEKDSLFLRSKQSIGELDWSRDFRNRKDNAPSNKIIKYSPSCTEGHNSTTCSKEKIYVTDNEECNPCAFISTKPFQTRERHNDDADDHDMVGIAENPSIRVDEPVGKDSPLPHRRKPKLRSLADIMEEEKNLTNEHPRTRSAPSNEMQVVESAEVEAHSDPHLQLDVPVGVAKGTRSPPGKRKICLDEDRGSLEITYPIGTAKRSKGLILDAERTCKRIKITDKESEGDASTPLDLQPSERSQHIKPKKSKALDLSRKVRRTHVDNRTVSVKEVPEINAVHSANSHKHALNAETSFSNTEHVPSKLGGEMGSYLKSFLSGQKADRISGPCKRPEVEAIHRPLMSSRKSVLGDRNVQGVAALVLPLNSCMNAKRNSNDNQASLQQHSVIPDLNVSFTEKPSMMQGKQWSDLPEDRSSTLNKNVDMSASCSKEMIREGKRQPGVSEPQPIRSMDNNLVRGGPSDDIPMEIVKLLAKNQRKRALENSRKTLLPEVINNSIRGTHVYMDMTNFPFTNTSGTSGKRGFDQGTLKFPRVKNPQIGIVSLEESQRFRLFDSCRPSQQKKPQYSSSNSVLSRPRHSEGADLLWSPRRKNVPFHLSTDENHSIRSNDQELDSFSNRYYKGKGIIDLNGREKKTMYNSSAVKEGRIGSSSKSLDAYSNDAIPAVQLLSLMDRGIASGSSSVKIGSLNGFLDKRFSPCYHHPRLNGNEKQINDQFLSSSFFSQSSHTKDFSPLLNGVCFSGASLKKPSHLQGQMPPQQQGKPKNVDFAGPSNLVIHQPRGNVALGDCTLNRNPADFSTPNARNEYTISYKDLKPRKINYPRKEGSRPANVEGDKRQRMRKDASSSKSK